MVKKNIIKDGLKKTQFQIIKIKNLVTFFYLRNIYSK